MLGASNFHGFHGWKSRSENLIRENLSLGLLGLQTRVWDMEISMAGYPIREIWSAKILIQQLAVKYTCRENFQVYGM